MKRYTSSFNHEIYTEDGKQFSLTDDSLPIVLTVTAEGSGWFEPARITADPYYSTPADGEFSVSIKSIQIEDAQEYDEEKDCLVEKILTAEEEENYKRELVDFLEDNEDYFEED